MLKEVHSSESYSVFELKTLHTLVDSLRNKNEIVKINLPNRDSIEHFKLFGYY